MLYVLALTVSDADVVTKLHLERLGVTSSASAICYLDNGVVFLGSCLGDSQARASLRCSAWNGGAHW
eukprot:scaffold133183_cov30-Tisochrysis_lutea.AAC.5